MCTPVFLAQRTVGGHVGGVERLDDGERLDRVVGAVVLEPCERVAGAAARQDRAANRRGERLQARIARRPGPVGDRERSSQPSSTDEQVAAVQGLLTISGGQ